MAKPSKPRNFSRQFLLGVALSTLPLAGCEYPAGGMGSSSPGNGGPTVTATAGELAAFERARDQGTVAAAEAFLRDYPDSELIRRLLIDLPPATLQGIDDTLVAGLDTSLVNSLPFRVKQQLGLLVPTTDKDDGPRPSDGYS